MLTLSQAQKMTEKAVAKAEELGIAITVTIVDAHGVLLSAQRMEKALPISPEFAFAKAYTSAVLRMPTADIGAYATPGKPYYGVTSAFAGKLMVIAGGIPIIENNTVIGAIGVGGSADVAQDVACAQAAIA
jgi:uncharacterized protein GlcG (DUF336 family)